jgi:hypothetical protein
MTQDERIAALEAERDALAAAMGEFGPCPQCGGYGRAGQMWRDEDGEAMCYSDMSCDCGGVRPEEILAARDARMKRAGALEALRGLPTAKSSEMRHNPITYNYLEGWNQYRECVDDHLAALEAEHG